MFYGKSSVKQTGPRAGRAVLQLHPALRLLHRGPVRLSTRMPQRRPTVHWVLLLGTVKEPGTDYAAPHYGKGTLRAIPARRGPACRRPSRLTPASQISGIFVLTGDRGGQGRGRKREGRRGRPQEPAIRQRGGGRGAGENRDGQGKTRGTKGEGRRTTEATEMTETATGWQGILDDPPEHRTNARAGGKYRAGSSKTEESADEKPNGGERTRRSRRQRRRHRQRWGRGRPEGR